MPGIDAAGTLTVPIWLAGAASAVFVTALLLAAKRAGGVGLITSLFRSACSRPLSSAPGFWCSSATSASAALSMIARWR
jgi:hypothetical protein